MKILDGMVRYCCYTSSSIVLLLRCLLSRVVPWRCVGHERKGFFVVLLSHTASFFLVFLLLFLLLLLLTIEVKIKREHVQGSADNDNIKPQVEPITEETVRRMENPQQVQVCKSSSSNNKKE